MKKTPHPRRRAKTTPSPQALPPIKHREGSEGHYRDAVYYDRRYRHRRADVRYYVELAERSGGPVLELGVGTGRVALAMASLGIEVVGVDRMGPMLAQARQRLLQSNAITRRHVTLLDADIRNLRLSRRFALVIAPFNVFMHLYTRQDMELALATVRRHLQNGGLFAFDVSNPDPKAMARNPTRIYRCRPVRHPKKKEYYNYAEAFHYDGPSQVMHMSLILEHPDDPMDVHMTALSQRQFFPAELEALLHYNGFSMQKLDGGFSGQPLTTEAESLVVLATAATGRRSHNQGT